MQQPRDLRIPRPYVRGPYINRPGTIEDQLKEARKRAFLTMQKQRTAITMNDPWLNQAVKAKYDSINRTLINEVAGRSIGSLQGAGLGAGIGSIIGATVGLAVGAAIPGIGDEIVTTAAGTKIGTALGIKVGSAIATAFGKMGAASGAAAGAVAGASVADYRTYYATKELIDRTIFESFRNPGTGLMNSLESLGYTLDQSSGAPIIKSTILGAIRGEDISELILKSYGIHKDGREARDFTEIREELKIDVGGVGNFTIDMLGEILTDPGAVSALVGKPISLIPTKKVLSESITNNTDDLLKVFGDDLVAKNKFIKQYRRALLSRDTNDITKVFIENKKLTEFLSNEAVRTGKASANQVLEELSQKIIGEVSEQTSYKIYKYFDAVDEWDDFLTAKYFQTLSAPGAVYAGFKYIKKIDTNFFDSAGAKLFKGKFRTAQQYNKFYNEVDIDFQNEINKIIDDVDTTPFTKKAASEYIPKKTYEELLVDEKKILTDFQNAETEELQKKIWEELKKVRLEKLKANPIRKEFQKSISKIRENFNQYQMKRVMKNGKMKIEFEGPKKVLNRELPEIKQAVNSILELLTRPEGQDLLHELGQSKYTNLLRFIKEMESKTLDSFFDSFIIGKAKKFSRTTELRELKQKVLETPGAKSGYDFNVLEGDSKIEYIETVLKHLKKRNEDLHTAFLTMNQLFFGKTIGIQRYADLHDSTKLDAIQKVIVGKLDALFQEEAIPELRQLINKAQDMKDKTTQEYLETVKRIKDLRKLSKDTAETVVGLMNNFKTDADTSFIWSALRQIKTDAKMFQDSVKLDSIPNKQKAFLENVARRLSTTNKEGTPVKYNLTYKQDLLNYIKRKIEKTTGEIEEAYKKSNTFTPEEIKQIKKDVKIRRRWFRKNQKELLDKIYNLEIAVEKAEASGYAFAIKEAKEKVSKAYESYYNIQAAMFDEYINFEKFKPNIGAPDPLLLKKKKELEILLQQHEQVEANIKGSNVNLKKEVFPIEDIANKFPETFANISKMNPKLKHQLMFNQSNIFKAMYYVEADISGLLFKMSKLDPNSGEHKALAWILEDRFGFLKSIKSEAIKFSDNPAEFKKVYAEIFGSGKTLKQVGDSIEKLPKDSNVTLVDILDAKNLFSRSMGDMRDVYNLVDSIFAEGGQVLKGDTIGYVAKVENMLHATRKKISKLQETSKRLKEFSPRQNLIDRKIDLFTKLETHLEEYSYALKTENTKYALGDPQSPMNKLLEEIKKLDTEQTALGVEYIMHSPEVSKYPVIENGKLKELLGRDEARKLIDSMMGPDFIDKQFMELFEGQYGYIDSIIENLIKGEDPFTYNLFAKRLRELEALGLNEINQKIAELYQEIIEVLDQAIKTDSLDSKQIQKILETKTKNVKKVVKFHGRFQALKAIEDSELQQLLENIQLSFQVNQITGELKIDISDMFSKKYGYIERILKQENIFSSDRELKTFIHYVNKTKPVDLSVSTIGKIQKDISAKTRAISELIDLMESKSNLDMQRKYHDGHVGYSVFVSKSSKLPDDLEITRENILYFDIETTSINGDGIQFVITQQDANGKYYHRKLYLKADEVLSDFDDEAVKVTGLDLKRLQEINADTSNPDNAMSFDDIILRIMHMSEGKVLVGFNTGYDLQSIIRSYLVRKLNLGKDGFEALKKLDFQNEKEVIEAMKLLDLSIIDASRLVKHPMLYGEPLNQMGQKGFRNIDYAIRNGLPLRTIDSAGNIMPDSTPIVLGKTQRFIQKSFKNGNDTFELFDWNPAKQAYDIRGVHDAAVDNELLAGTFNSAIGAIRKVGGNDKLVFGTLEKRNLIESINDLYEERLMYATDLHKTLLDKVERHIDHYQKYGAIEGAETSPNYADINYFSETFANDIDSIAYKMKLIETQKASEDLIDSLVVDIELVLERVERTKISGLETTVQIFGDYYDALTKMQDDIFQKDLMEKIAMRGSQYGLMMVNRNYVNALLGTVIGTASFTNIKNILNGNYDFMINDPTAHSLQELFTDIFGASAEAVAKAKGDASTLLTPALTENISRLRNTMNSIENSYKFLNEILGNKSVGPDKAFLVYDIFNSVQKNIKYTNTFDDAYQKELKMVIGDIIEKAKLKYPKMKDIDSEVINSIIEQAKNAYDAGQKELFYITADTINEVYHDIHKYMIDPLHVKFKQTFGGQMYNGMAAEALIKQFKESFLKGFAEDIRAPLIEAKSFNRRRVVMDLEEFRQMTGKYENSLLEENHKYVFRNSYEMKHDRYLKQQLYRVLNKINPDPDLEKRLSEEFFTKYNWLENIQAGRTLQTITKYIGIDDRNFMKYLEAGAYDTALNARLVKQFDMGKESLSKTHGIPMQLFEDEIKVLAKGNKKLEDAFKTAIMRIIIGEEIETVYQNHKQKDVLFKLLEDIDIANGGETELTKTYTEAKDNLLKVLNITADDWNEIIYKSKNKKIYNAVDIEMFEELVAGKIVFEKYGTDFKVVKRIIENIGLILQEMGKVTEADEIVKTLKGSIVKLLREHVDEGKNVLSYMKRQGAKESIEVLKHAKESSELFDNFRKMFTRVDGSVDEAGALAFLRSNPEYKLFTINDQMKPIEISLDNAPIGQILKDSEFRYISILDRDSFMKLQIKLDTPPLDETSTWLQSHILRPMKLLMLYNPAFLIGNIIDIYTKNLMIRDNKLDLVGAFNDTVRSWKDFHQWQKIYQDVTLDYDLWKDFGTELDRVDANWVDWLMKKVNDVKSKTADGIQLTDKEAQYLAKYGALNDETYTLLKHVNGFQLTEASTGHMATLKRNEMVHREKQNNIRKLKEQDYDQLSKEEKILLYVANPDPNIPKYDHYTGDARKFSSLEEELQYLNGKIEDIRKKRITVEDASVLYRRRNTIKKIKDEVYFKNVYGAYHAIGLQKYLDINQTLESVGRLAAFNRGLADGMTKSEAVNTVLKTHFSYANKSVFERYSEFLIPFISYPMRSMGLWMELMQDGDIARIVTDFALLNWGEVDYEGDYLKHRKTRGDIPIGNGTLMELENPAMQALRTAGSPLEAINNKMNPLFKPIVDSIMGAENPRWGHYPGSSIINDAVNLATNENVLESPSQFAPSLFGEYYERQPYRQRQYARNYYKSLYTKSGYSRVKMRMQPLTLQNLPYRVNDIMWKFRKF